MRQSMSRAANCYDNAFMESCFGTIKTELEMTEYQHSPQARGEVASYLAYYNAERRHSSLDYLSPAVFKALLPSSHYATQPSENCQAAQLQAPALGGRSPSRRGFAVASPQTGSYVDRLSLDETAYRIDAPRPRGRLRYAAETFVWA
jgi:hypothetical protein